MCEVNTSCYKAVKVVLIHQPASGRENKASLAGTALHGEPATHRDGAARRHFPGFLGHFGVFL